MLNGRSPQLTDPAVRRAVLRAIDRESIARSGLKGLDWAYTPMNNHFLVPGQNGYRDNSAGLSQYDVDTADAELDKAGWDRPGFGMRSKDGKPLTLRLVVPQTGQVAAAESTQVLEMLALAGIQVTVQKVPNADFLATYVNRHDFDLTLLDITGTPFPATSLASTFQQGAGGNVSQVGSQALDEAIADAASGETAKEGYEAINRADEQAWQVARPHPAVPAAGDLRRAAGGRQPGRARPVRPGLRGHRLPEVAGEECTANTRQWREFAIQERGRIARRHTPGMPKYSTRLPQNTSVRLSDGATPSTIRPGIPKTDNRSTRIDRWRKRIRRPHSGCHPGTLRTREHAIQLYVRF
ncbi:ABC transporter substrate-binding protein [Kitasatospora arboriphila]